MNKDLLAKLLANENLTVLQEPVKTASFDVKNRVLRLPQWKDLSDDLLDLFIGHEVGHALYTTSAFWSDELKQIKHFQGYLNVLEDVRIEKLIKRKYPGLRKPFRIGYDELREKDFFNLKKQDINSLLLIDRINLFYKAGVKSGVKFTKEESEFVRRAEYTTTIEQVIQLAKEIYEFTKQELQDKLDEMKNQDPHNDDFEQEETESAGEDVFGDTDEDVEFEESDSHSYGTQAADAEDLMESQTERALREKLEELADQSVVNVYYKLPKHIEDSEIFYDYKHVIKTMEEGNSDWYSLYRSKESDEFKENFKTRFLGSSKKIINYMVKEFEMKKAADNYKRTKRAKSGSLNMSRLYQYKLNDDIFKRINVVPDGKNHGMVMLVDWSASMDQHIRETLHQVVNLSMFCKSAQIPFSVVGLSTEYNARRYDEHGSRIPRADRVAKVQEDEVNPYGDLSLMELLSSKMSNKEFKFVTSKLITSDIFKYTDFQLGGTPLNEALVYMTKYLPLFKAKHNVQKLSFITLTDGEGACLMDNDNFALKSRRVLGPNNEYYTKKAFLHDEITKKNYPLLWSDSHTEALLDVIKNRVGCTVLGFYIFKYTQRNLSNAYHNNTSHEKRSAGYFWTIVDELKKKIRDNGYASLDDTSYDDLFLVPTKSLTIDDSEELNITDDMSAAKIATQMKKMFGSKKKSRLLLNKFIEMIA